MTTKKAIFWTLGVYLCIAVFGLSVALGLAQTSPAEDDDTYRNLVEASFQRSYYDLTAAVTDISVKLKKLDVSTDAEMQESLLFEVWKTAELAENGLANLSALDDGVASTLKFLNQTGDYAYWLAGEIGESTTINDTQRETLAKMAQMYDKLSVELDGIRAGLTEGALFLGTSLAADAFSGLSSESVEYPQMIYDGPFSDALLEKDVKGLSGEDITEEGARAILDGIFEGYAVTDVVFAGEYDTDIVTLNFTLKVDGASASLQLAKQGGTVVQLSVYAEPNATTKTREEYVQIAKDDAANLGFADMTAVWYSVDENCVYVNLAPTSDGVILYPDMVKVKLAADTGSLLGLDSRNYVFNHTERTLETPVLTEEQAAEKLSESLSADEGRLTLIPLDDGTERLTYEFHATSGGEYFVYIDAATGAEVNILYVIIMSEESAMLL